MRAADVLGTGAVLAVIATLAACGTDPPARPSPPPGPAPASQVVRVEISGPSSIAPGESAPYSAIEHLSNGTTRVAQSAAWSSSQPGVLQITQAGVATAQRTGEAVISVRTTLGASQEVLVLPAGTFRLVGMVTDATRTDVAISEAIVQVVGGPLAWTTSTGHYRLYGVPSETRISVSRVGYRTVSEQIQLTAHATRDFRLDVERPPPDYAGNYTLVVTARSTCPGPVPLRPDLRERSYQAVIRQEGSQLFVRLIEPRFVSHPNFPTDQFVGQVMPAGAQFTIAWNYDYYGDRASNIMERLSDGSSLMITGTAAPTGSPSGLSGSFNGGFVHWGGGWIGDCPGATFALTPR